MTTDPTDLPAINIPDRTICRVIGRTELRAGSQVEPAAPLDPDVEHRAMELRLREEETFWNLRYRNRP
jgi:hypothetical protein